MPCSGKEEIISLTNSSNIGENGVWIFRIDQDTIEPACKDKGEHEYCTVAPVLLLRTRLLYIG